MKFKCHCNNHIIEIDDRPLVFKKDGKIVSKEDFLSICIFRPRNQIDGKKLKKPVLEGDAVLIGSEARRFKKWVKRHN